MLEISTAVVQSRKKKNGYPHAGDEGCCDSLVIVIFTGRPSVTYSNPHPHPHPGYHQQPAEAQGTEYRGTTHTSTLARFLTGRSVGN